MTLSPAIMFVAAASVMRGYFSGLGTMKPTSISQTLEQFLNCTLTITFVYALVGKDPSIMAAGGNISTTLAIIIAFTYLYMFYKRRKKGIMADINNQTEEMQDETTGKIIKTIIVFAVPLTLASLISVINNLIDTVTISNCIQYAYQGIIMGKSALEAEAMRLAGILSKVETIMRLPLAINIAFLTALVPAIASSIAKKDMALAQKRLSFSFFASVLIIMPCVVGLSVLAGPILKMLYPAAPDGAGVMALTTITMLFVALTYVLDGRTVRASER
ncbi:MAG: oligosaccharide flippase family protein [Firmicutes bacterium]|nr:oligosaccharide flippase family protein [Bacillota bacterium]